MEKFDEWLTQISYHEDDFAYRVIDLVYRIALSGSERSDNGVLATRRPDGGFDIHAGDETISLADDAEREALAAHIVRRYCGDRYPDMEAWHRQQHLWSIEDRDNWARGPWTPWQDFTWWLRDKRFDFVWWWRGRTGK